MIPWGARTDRPDYDYLDGLRLRVFPGGSGARSVTVFSGIGWTRKVAVAMNASVPREPHMSFGRSKPATVFTTLPPPFARVPSARTTEIPMIKSRTDPYRVRSGP